MRFYFPITMIFILIVASVFGQDQFPTSRNVYKWPFSTNSIWNMPIGSNAEYVHAKLLKANLIGVDEDLIVMTPNEPLMKIKEGGGWGEFDRCTVKSKLLFEAPIPQSWVVSRATWVGNTPNAGLAVLMPDLRTINQTQPFAHCTVGGDATSLSYTSSRNVDIYGEGIIGPHGGSHMSALGGTLRLGELTPTSGPIRHALKFTIWGKNFYYDTQTKGYRWPAISADAKASTNYQGTVKECRMGSLLALPASLDIATLGLKTEPAKIIAQALQDYGAYIVDDAGWDCFYFIPEWGPAGRFTTEFKKNWGFQFTGSRSLVDNGWFDDIMKLVVNLHVVNNNTSATLGGGGEPRQPLAPPFESVSSVSEHTMYDGVVLEEYFNIHGQKMTKPQGFCIVKQTLQSGKMQSKKVVIKK